MTIDCDAVVVGAGVVGLAIARKLAFSGQKVLVLEKASRAGTETSARNSEVIHAGIYYPTGSLKARLCVEGREQLYAYCASTGVAHKRLGKLVVATSAVEEEKLLSIANLAKANGVYDLHWLSQDEVNSMEPELFCTKALLSLSTGIVDAGGLMMALQGEAEMQGTRFAFNTRFVKAKKTDAGFIVTAQDTVDVTTELTTRILINAAGLGAYDVVTKIQGYPIQKCPPRFLAKGSYCSVTGKSPFQHLVYPVPVSGALGIHATLDLAGALRLGPNIQWVETVDYTLPHELPETFATAVRAYWPSVKEHRLTASYCGIRPKIHGPDQHFADFNIQTAEEHGVGGLITLFGIESPGLTACMAIADHVVQRLCL